MKKIIDLIMMVILLAGCGGRLVSLPATMTYDTAVHRDLISLPLPKKKIYATVYEFSDQSGQYKDDDNFTNSTAVTQGATSMLIKALEDSGWFVVVEREGINDLFTERKIIRSTRAEYEAEMARNKIKNEEDIPPLSALKYASVFFRGGIIAYETNVSTGGFAARYFGIGGSTEYRSHQVTICLRIVSADDGVVLGSYFTTKSIASKEVDFSTFRYVERKKLLELNMGVTGNEPVQMCVREAIEKAVVNMILEGILKKGWVVSNPDDVKTSSVVLKYLDEQYGKSKKALFNKKGELVRIEE